MHTHETLIHTPETISDEAANEILRQMMELLIRLPLSRRDFALGFLKLKANHTAIYQRG
jgi:hypothetical protein